MNPQWQRGRRPGLVVLGLVVAGLVAACATAAPPRLSAAVPAGAPATPPAATASPSPSTPAPVPSVTSVTPSPTPSASKTRTAPAPKPTAARTPPPPRKPTPPPTLASRLHTLPAATRQVVIVHASGYDTTHATLETFTRTSAGWVRAFAPMSARIGGQGFSDHHVEGVATTPIGVYGFGATMYGLNPDPHVKYAYHHLVPGDWWNENSGSSRYNTFVHAASSPGGASEALWHEPVAYQYFAFITYNVPAKAGRGSGIFLHVSKGNPTAGCIALSEPNLLKVLTWLDPNSAPRVVIAPDSQLGRF